MVDAAQAFSRKLLNLPICTYGLGNSFPGKYAHPIMVHVLDAQGRVLAQYVLQHPYTAFIQITNASSLCNPSGGLAQPARELPNFLRRAMPCGPGSIEAHKNGDLLLKVIY